MARVTFRPPTDADCVALAATLRLADREELAVTSGRDPLDALRHSVRQSSHAVAAIDSDGAVICIFGCGAIGFMSDEGCVWLLASDRVARYWRLFVRLSARYLASILDIYPVIYNEVDARNQASVRWLRWLGFTVERPAPIGRDGAMLQRFYLRRGLYVGKGSVAEVEDATTFEALMEEYASEAAIAGMPAPSAKLPAYRHLESVGVLHVYVATLDGRLIGFITVLASVLPHYGATVAVTESFFVAKEYRNTLAGLKLLAKAEECAREVGSPGLLVSAPAEGALSKVLPRAGYREASKAFFKAVSHG